MFMKTCRNWIMELMVKSLFFCYQISLYSCVSLTIPVPLCGCSKECPGVLMIESVGGHGPTLLVDVPGCRAMLLLLLQCC